MKLIFATRPSALARWQTGWVITALQTAHPDLICEEKVILTRGDKILDKPLPEIGGKGLFTQELENQILSGEAHCAVHSLKDLPVENTSGLIVGCVPIRADARDVFISRENYALNTLPSGSVVGTSSLRRAAQLLSARPDISVHTLRGNVDTRLRKALEGQYDAIILAGAGLIRLGLQTHITQWLPLDVMLPAPGQGVLAVQCRADDQATRSLLSTLEHAPTRAAVVAERQFLHGLGGGCAVPVAALGTVSEEWHEITLTGLVAAVDGTRLIKVTGAGLDPLELGDRLAQQAITQGAKGLLALKAEQTG